MKDPRPNKRLGQHYLHNPNTLQRMLDEIAPAAGECFIEIGPGSGALTLPLAELLSRRQGKLLALELDARMLPVLAEKLDGLPGVAVKQADALRDDLTPLIAARQIKHARLVGNLPYNLSVHLIEKFLLLANFGLDPAGEPGRQEAEDGIDHEQVRKVKNRPSTAGSDLAGESQERQEAEDGIGHEQVRKVKTRPSAAGKLKDERDGRQPLAEFCIDDMHFLVQQEIAQRLFAEAGSRNYGRLAIMAGVLGGGGKLFKVPPGDFYPPPKVTSSFIKLIPQLHPEFAAMIGGETKRARQARPNLDPAISQQDENNAQGRDKLSTAEGGQAADKGARQARGYHQWRLLNQLVTAGFARPNRKLSNTLEKLPAYRAALEQTGLANKRARETSITEFLSLLAAGKE